MPLRIMIDQNKLANFCDKWKIAELAFFGSVLREDFRPDSDIDVLVTFLPDAHITLFDLVDMTDELTSLFNRQVDLVPKEGLKPRIRQSVLDTAQVVYVAA